jgi:hypothetical protein
MKTGPIGGFVRLLKERNIATAQKRQVDDKIMETVQLFLYDQTN